MNTKLLLGQNDEREFLFYKDKNFNLKYSKFFLFKNTETEKTVVENCVSFCGDTDKKGMAHLLALTDKNQLVYIKAFENEIKKWTFSGNEKKILPESLGILCLEEKCLVLLCLKKDDEFFYTSFFLSSEANEQRLVCKTKKYYSKLYFAVENSTVNLILKNNGVLLCYDFSLKEEVWKKVAEIRLSKKETEAEFVLKNKGTISGIFKIKNTLFYFSADENSSKPKKVTPLTKRHLPGHERPFLVFDKQKKEIFWCGEEKIFKAEKATKNDRWSKLKEYDPKIFGELFVRRKNGKSYYIFENRLLRQNMQNAKNIEENFVLIKKILCEHEKEIDALKRKYKYS